MHPSTRSLLFLIAGWFLTGFAMAIEEPSYKVTFAEGDFEIRHYAPLLVAETVVDGDMDEASNKGFRRIADFIFGNNQRSDSEGNAKIAMTAPVTVEPQSSKIAMTAPVTVEPQAGASSVQTAHRWRVQFVMPSQYTLANIPQPKNREVTLREVPAQHFVVLTYSGLNTLARVERKTQEALQWAKEKSIALKGTPQLARYDPPWTLPMFRRNEIMIEITPP